MPLVFALLLLSVPERIDTVAGSGWVGDDGAATSAILLQAEGITSDPQGNLYVSDAADHRVRKVTPAGIITTVAGTGEPGFSGDGGPAVAARLNTPYGLAFERGNLYIADLGNARVRRVATDGTITTIAGGGAIPAGGMNEGSAATVLSLITPRNLVPDGYGSLYISDFGGQRVYRLGPDGALTTFAGTGTRGYSGDGTVATLARIAYPTGLAIDGQGALYIADSQNHVVRKVMRGVISTIARALTPTGLAFDSFGSLYIADPYGAQIIQVPAAGSAKALATNARDLAFGRDGYLYAVDGSVVRRVSFTGASAIVAGGGSLARGDHGPATLASLNHPSGVTMDSLGNLYIADRDNHRIRQVAPDGTITTIAGTGLAGDSGDGGLATQARLSSPSAVSVDARGNLYIADTGNQRVRKVTPSGVILSVTSTGLVAPAHLVTDPDENVYISDAAKGTISKVSSAGAMTTLLDGLQSPQGMAFDSAGNLYFTEAGGRRLQRMAKSGNLTSLGGNTWSAPRGVAVTETGDVFVADAGLQQIVRIDSSGQVMAVAGTGSVGFSGDGGAGTAADLSFPWDIAAGQGGKLYVADLYNNRIRRLTPFQVVAVNAASLLPGPVAPGMLIVLRGTDLTNSQVFVNGISTPILGAGNAGLMVQGPAELAGLQSAQIRILSRGSVLADIPVAVVPAAPALFASVTNEDGMINSAANPAPRGSVVTLYGTGEGVSGLPISARIGDFLAEVLYAGPVVGYPGLLQVNARVPAGYVAPGEMSVMITVGEASSQLGVRIAVN